MNFSYSGNNIQTKYTTSKKKKGTEFSGPPLWRTLHIICAAYQPGYASDVKTFVVTLSRLLECQCKDCANHFKRNLIEYPIDSYLSNNEDLFFWSYLLHDIVNIHYNKTHPGEPPKISPPYEDCKKEYFDGVGGVCYECGKH